MTQSTAFTYKDLDVWKRAVSLAIRVYQVTRTFPAEEKYGLCAQIQRAAISIPANVAEGWGRGSRKEYVQFLTVARGSLMELETHLFIAEGLEYITDEQLGALQRETADIGMMLNRLMQSLRRTEAN